MNILAVAQQDFFSSVYCTLQILSQISSQSDKNVVSLKFK